MIMVTHPGPNVLDSTEAKFYCLQALADDNQHTSIREKTVLVSGFTYTLSTLQTK